MSYEIEKFNPCHESIIFRQKYNSFQEAWNNCPRGDWMLWIAKRLNIDNRLLTLCKAYCARTVYHLMKDERSTTAIIIAINYGRNLATKEELINAANAAYDAAYTAYDAAYTATYTAAAAAYAANADNAANAAAYAANAAAATADATADAAKTKNRLKTAKICRKYLTQAVFEKI